MGNQTP